ncbi:hypothetical protein BSL78_15770 [Apostichopus japonicus]|uniref:Uncharacterized protein n=1 Tax=Stichopus japonicus TaxID=307972 RepID=A0A2G8KH77_STIJA|nr:hypothetical protein BSL78_15770 [Apostichopus japonicus]
MGHFFNANAIKDKSQKKSIMLNSIGSDSYKLLRNLCAPKKPGEQSYKNLVDLLANHYHPYPSVIVQRCMFNSRFWLPSESVATFVSELRSLADTCNFETVLDDMLRDRLVCGINNDNIQKRLLSEADLTFEKALNVTIATETASQNVADLQRMGSASQAGQLNALNNKTGFRPSSDTKATDNTKPCYRCGRKNHAQRLLL